MLLAMASQPIDSAPTFATGGDVSRFQRRSVPARTAQQPARSPSAPLRPLWSRRRCQCRSGRPVGPVVRVARGNNVSFVPVGAR